MVTHGADGRRGATAGEGLTQVAETKRDAVPTLEALGIVVNYGGIRAVNDVSLQLNDGCLGIIGPNGAGKTTLLDALAGLRRPNQGRVLLDGDEVTSRSSTWLARHGIRRTFQRHQAFGWLTVEENLLVAAEWRGRSMRILNDLFGLPSGKRRQQAMASRVDAAIERCGLQSVRNERAATLPIGQIRLMEFARAIIDRPRVLLLDEPTSGLPAEDTARLAEVVRQITTEDNCAAILVEHDVDFVSKVADRVLVLQVGSVLAEGETQSVLSNPQVMAAYLGDAV